MQLKHFLPVAKAVHVQFTASQIVPRSCSIAVTHTLLCSAFTEKQFPDYFDIFLQGHPGKEGPPGEKGSQVGGFY